MQILRWFVGILAVIVADAIVAVGQGEGGGICGSSAAELSRPEHKSVWIMGEAGQNFDSQVWDGTTLTAWLRVQGREGCKYSITTEMQESVGGVKRVLGKNEFDITKNETAGEEVMSAKLDADIGRDAHPRMMEARFLHPDAELLSRTSIPIQVSLSTSFPLGSTPSPSRYPSEQEGVRGCATASSLGSRKPLRR